MSMLIRTGTLVRKNTRKSSVRRTKSVGSTTSSGHVRAADDGDGQSTCSVPPSPVAKLHQLYTDHSLNNSPGKSSVATTTSTIVSFDDKRLDYKTSVAKGYPGSANIQATSLQIVEANSESDNICEFLCTSCQIICSSTFVAGAVGLTLIVPVVMIVFGVKYMDECPLEPRIPIFLIVGGCFGIVKILVVLGRYVQNRHRASIDNLAGVGEDDQAAQSKTYRSINSVLSLFLIAWNVLGSFWILRIWKPRFEPLLHRPDVWCQRSLYFFSLAIIIAAYAVLALMSLGVVCLVCMYRASGSRGSRRGRAFRS